MIAFHWRCHAPIPSSEMLASDTVVDVRNTSGGARYTDGRYLCQEGGNRRQKHAPGLRAACPWAGCEAFTRRGPSETPRALLTREFRRLPAGTRHIWRRFQCNPLRRPNISGGSETCRDV